jgi:hypothetical protein
MEVDSFEEDGSMRDYWKKKEKRKEKQGKKDRKGKRSSGKDSEVRGTGTDQEGQDTKASEPHISQRTLALVS